MAAVAAVAFRKRKSDALKVWNAELEFKVTRLHSKANEVRQLSAKVTGLGRNVKRMTASLPDAVNMRDEAVETAGNLSAQLAASVCCEDAYTSELTSVIDDLVKTRVKRTSLRCSANRLVAKVLEASVDLCGALQAVPESSNRLYKDIADES